MTRDEFLGRLGELLACLPADQVRETQEFYAEAIADRMEDGMGEEEAVAAMGAPGEVAEAVLDDLPAVPRAIARTRRRSTTLLWVLTIVGSPVWVPLLLAFAAVAVAVYVCIWILALCVWIVAAALGGAGVVLAAIGFIVSGCDPAVFNTQIDLRDDTVVLGGVEVDDPTGLPLIEQLSQVGEVDVSAPTAPEAPAAP